MAVQSNELMKSTQPGHPSVGKLDEYKRKLGRKVWSWHTARCTSWSVIWRTV